jgi:hypothetical protein
MPLIEANWNPTSRQLCQFGWLCAAALPLIAWLWSASLMVIGICAAVGVSLALLGLALPRALAPVFIALMLVATPIGIVVGELAMLAIFLLVFFPMGILFRLLRRDRLQRKIDHSAASYWTTKQQPKSLASYYHQS